MPALPAEKAGGFAHLHLHTEYSLLDGGNRIDRLVARVKELGMDSVAVTDHGNMFGAVSFYSQAKAAGVKPILGVEAYVAPGDRTDRTYTGASDGGYHLVLLAENRTGWDHLLHLCSQAYLTGFYFKPRIDRALLRECSSGLIAINGHLGSEMGEHLLSYERSKDKAKWAAAVESAEWHAETFADEGTGPRFFVELQHHVPEQIAINPHLIKIAEELNLPLVGDNDSHFLKAEDHDAHDTLICISTGKAKADPQRMRYTPELYVKSPEQMREIFHREYGEHGREAMDNTVRIADRCDVELPIGANHAPMVRVVAPEDLPRHDDPSYSGDLTRWYGEYCARFELEPFESDTEEDVDEGAIKEACDHALRLMAEAGMVWRYGGVILEHRHEWIEGTSEAAKQRQADGVDTDGFDKWARLNRELKILADKLISAYFLIVWDFVNWGRQRGVPSMARGSGVGTMVGYVLGFSNACPVRYGLLFERFTDPDRTEYPDIDIDLCQDGRGDVIEYVRQKYGHVAQIITFGTLKARAAVRDVARVLEVPLPKADAIAKAIPEALGTTFDSALKDEPDFKKLYDTDPDVKRIVDNGRVMEGQARHASVHAAGVIVATRPLDQIVPLYKQAGAGDNEIVTQWDGPTCEKMGLLKMDFLGLRTLSVIERAKSLIRSGLDEAAIYAGVGREYRGGRGDGGPHPLDLERLTYDDRNVFSLFQRGDTSGVFQFESGGMRRLLVEMKPDRLEDLIAANALFRPGPMDLIPDYNRRKHGSEPVPSVHPIVDKFTAETYGVMVYQEQVMQIVHELGGIPLRAAYSLIKAISKKKAKIINAERPKFIEGAGEKGLGKKQADDLFELILKFAGYGFNKSHSTGYAIVAYQTAYLKTYFPAQYYAAFLTFESQAQKVADWIPYLDDARRAVFVDPKTKGPKAKVIKRGVDIKPPDVNRSDSDFAVVFEDGEPHDAHHGHVRFGMRALKGAGSKAIESIVAEREGLKKQSSAETNPVAHGGGIDGNGLPPGLAAKSGTKKQRTPFRSLHDFCERMPSGSSNGAVNKATIEALIKAGAFDSVHGRDARASLVASIEGAVSAGQRIAADRAAGQSVLFGGGDTAEVQAPEPTLEKMEAWSESETLKQEKETLGFYVSSHPLEQWKHWVQAFPTKPVRELKGLGQDARVIVAVMAQSVRQLVMKTGRNAGRKMAIITMEDATGTADSVMFADCFERYGSVLEDDEPFFLLGRVDHSRGEPQIIVDRLVPIAGVPLEKGTLRVVVREQRLNGDANDRLAALHRCMISADGVVGPEGTKPVPVELVVDTDLGWASIEPKTRVALRPELVREVSELLGDQSVRLVGGVSVEVEEPRGRRRNRASE